MAMKPRKEMGYDDPKPDTVLLQIGKGEFKKNDNDEQLFQGGVKVIDTVKVPENMDKSMGLFFELFEKNGRTFSAEEFLGLIEVVNGKAPAPDDCSFFDDVKVQNKIQKQLKDGIFGATLYLNTWKDKTTGEPKEKVKFKSFLTKDEFMAMKKSVGTTASATPNDQSKPSSGAGDTATEGEGDW